MQIGGNMENIRERIAEIIEHFYYPQFSLIDMIKLVDQILSALASEDVGLTDKEIEDIIHTQLQDEDPTLGDYTWMVSDTERAIAQSATAKVSAIYEARIENARKEERERIIGIIDTQVKLEKDGRITVSKPTPELGWKFMVLADWFNALKSEG
jgi:hypothetical protein